MSCKNVLKPSELNRRITLQQVTTTTDAEGIATETWTDVVMLWSSRLPMSGQEYFAAASTGADITVKYRIRYRPGITAAMRLVDQHDGRIYKIAAVLDDYYGDRTQTHLMCEVHSDG